MKLRADCDRPMTLEFQVRSSGVNVSLHTDDLTETVEVSLHGVDFVVFGDREMSWAEFAQLMEGKAP